MTLAIDMVAGDALPATIGASDEPLVVMPFIDPAAAARAAAQLARRAGAAGRLLGVYDRERHGFIAIVNRVFRASVATRFAYLAQDAFGGREWLSHGLAALDRHGNSGTGGGLLAFNDGKWNGALAAFGLVDRGWALGNYDGDLFHPGYRSHYADVELTLIAMQHRRLRYTAEAMVVEVDWAKEGRPVAREDKVLYHRRNQTAFDARVTDPGLRRLFK